ncbi:MAG: DegT/DnrJ/EryC1/StrS family aminotransferase [Candidatus Omnitrophica bacterium]|nr:DegT/DnrJ/EryC1/StrS family aminotransferase [Candidatus Omnitrophota bacterium]
MKVPYINLIDQHADIKGELLEAMEQVLDTGQFILGPHVEEFERRFAELCHTRYAVGLNSGTDALMLALKVLGAGPGDEVITAPNSFATTATSIVLVGAKPVFVDIREDYNIDPDLIEAAITPRTKAIMPVHLTGHPADMGSIMDIAKKHKLFVVEDCAQAVCAEYHGKRVGSIGDMGCYSLHPLKTLNACGDGGIVTTNNKEYYERLRIYRNNGFKGRNECVVWSNNSRLDSIQAAVLLIKMDHIEEWTRIRRENAKFYQDSLANISQVHFPIDKPYEKSVYHTFVVQVERREELMAFLTEKGVDTKIHYPVPIHMQPAAKELGYEKVIFLQTDGQTEKIMSLPIYHGLTVEQLKYVVECIKEFYS